MARKALTPGIAMIPINQIKPRPNHETRAPDPSAVVALAESIAALGLLEPIVVDRSGHLVAGRTRLDALRLVAGTPANRESLLLELATRGGRPLANDVLDRAKALSHPQDKLAQVPVRVLDLDAVKNPNEALAAEIAENEHRREYTREEIEQLAARLRRSGYADRPGRPRRGEKALRPALSAIVGKSLRTIERILADTPERRGRPRLSAEGGRRTLVLSVDAALERDVRTLAEKQQRPLSAVARDVLRAGLSVIASE